MFNIQHQVLPVEELNLSFVAELRTESIDELIIALREKARPVRRPLLIDMTHSTLMWNSGRKHDHRRSGNKIRDQSGSAFFREMFSDLQAQRKIRSSGRPILVQSNPSLETGLR